MESVLPTRAPVSNVDFIGRFLADHTRWFDGMSTPCPELAALYSVYAKLSILLALHARDPDGFYPLDSLAGCVELQSDEPDFRAPGECMVVAEAALLAMTSEGVVRMIDTSDEYESKDVLYALAAPGDVSRAGDPLAAWVRKTTLEAWELMARAEAACQQIAKPLPAPDWDARRSRDSLAVLDRLIARPGEWQKCPERWATWDLANHHDIERDDRGLFRVVDVTRAERRRDELLDHLKALNAGPATVKPTP